MIRATNTTAKIGSPIMFGCGWCVMAQGHVSFQATAVAVIAINATMQKMRGDTISSHSIKPSQSAISIIPIIVVSRVICCQLDSNDPPCQ